TPAGRKYGWPAASSLSVSPAGPVAANRPVVSGTTTYASSCRCSPVLAPGAKRHSVTRTRSLSILTVAVARRSAGAALTLFSLWVQPTDKLARPMRGYKAIDPVAARPNCLGNAEGG